MNILFVVEHFPCVSETFVLNQVTGLLDLGHEVTVCAVGKPSAAVIHADVEKYNLLERTWQSADVPGPRIERALVALSRLPDLIKRCGLRGLFCFNPRSHGKRAINLAFFYSCLPLVERQARFDAIHCHFGDKGLSALAWREMGLLEGPISTVFHAHELAGLTDRQGGRLYGPLFGSDALLLPISERWRQRLIHWGARSERTIVHRMGVDLAKFDFEQRAVVPPATLEILTIGRLTEQKGYAYAIRSVALLRTMTAHKLRYRIVGAGELEEPLQQLVAELGVADIVTFAGPQPQDVVRTHLRNAHIFLLPSVTAANGFQEGIPVALMEAMAAGVPVVSTRHSGIPELVEHEVSGLLAEERDSQSLAECMRRIIADPALATQLARRARMKVEAEYDIQKLNVRLAQLLQRTSDASASSPLVGQTSRR